MLTVAPLPLANNINGLTKLLFEATPCPFCPTRLTTWPALLLPICTSEKPAWISAVCAWLRYSAPLAFAAVPPALTDVCIAVPRGSLVAVIGPVGSGKSALCAAILGELSKAGGDVSVAGRVAYVPQTAWVLNASLRSNITFAAEAAAGAPVPAAPAPTTPSVPTN